MIIAEHIGELVRHRALIAALVGRELKGRYRGSILGFMWTFLNPLLLLLVYALVFSVYMRVEMENYAVFMFTGLLPWIFFSSSLTEGAGAISDGGSLVTKVMFPQQVLPAVRVLCNFINYLLSLPILLGFMLLAGIKLNLTLIAFPLVAAVHLMLTFGAALLLSAANVFLRDTKQLLGNLLTAWFFLTPILYPITQIPESYRWLALLNPAAVFSLAYQNIFFWGLWPDWLWLGAMALLGLVVLVAAVLIFESLKEYFAEKI